MRYMAKTTQKRPNQQLEFAVKYHSLYGFAKNPVLSLKSVKEIDNMVDLFRIPMTREAYNELLSLEEDLLDHRSDNTKDEKHVQSFIWGHQDYCVKKYYNHQFHSIQPLMPILWMWKSKCIPRIKFFTWLLLNDRLNTKNMLRRRKKFLESYNCVMGQCNVEETLEHLFFDCPCASAHQFALGIVQNENVSVIQKIQMAKAAFPYPFFMKIFMVSSQCLWNERNALVFNEKVPMFTLGRLASRRRLQITCLESSPLSMLLFGYGQTACNLFSFFWSLWASSSFFGLVNFWLNLVLFVTFGFYPSFLYICGQGVNPHGFSSKKLVARVVSFPI